MRFVLKRKRPEVEEETSEVNIEEIASMLGGLAGKRSALGSSDSIYSMHNHVYFNDDITMESMSALCREVRAVEERILSLSRTYGIKNAIPVILHITSYGGSLHSVFMAIDALEALRVPVHTVVEGYAASAATLLSVIGKKRYIAPNASMLIHELRSGVWGKHTEIEEEMQNLKKMMRQIVRHYCKYTPLEKGELKDILKHDLDWDAAECLAKGLVDEIGYP